MRLLMVLLCKRSVALIDHNAVLSRCPRRPVRACRGHEPDASRFGGRPRPGERFPGRRRLPSQLRDDLVQEVFLVVYRRLPDFDGGNLMGWLYRITTHQVRDYQRFAWIPHIFARGVDVSPQVPSVRPTPLMTLETRERQQKLEWLLSRLSERHRAAFVLFEIE